MGNQKKFVEWREGKWQETNTPNFGPPPAGYVPWRPTEKEIEEIRAGAMPTEAGKWDGMSPEKRALVRPDLNPNKRWFEQHRTVQFKG